MPDVNTPEPGLPEQRTERGRDTGRQSGTRHRGRWAMLPIFLILAAGGAGGWWFISRTPQQPAPPPPIKVPVMTVVGQTVPIYRSFPGTTQAMRTVTIQARVTGYLTEQGALDGADVASGTMLYRIDPSDYQVAYVEAQAALEQAAAGLRYAGISQRRNQREAHVGAVAQDSFDQANSTFDQDQASVANNKALVKEAALNLSRTELRAPFAGRISASQVFTGSLISVAGATLNTLVQLDPIYVSFNPAEVNLEAITREQARAPVETAVSTSGGSSGYKGMLTFIDNQISQTTGTILLKATIANPNRTLLPGQYVTATLHLGDLQGALLVPQSAVGSTQIGQTLMIVGDGNKVEQRIVKLGDSDGSMIVVTDGLKSGERIITGQLQKLRPGAQVQPEIEKSL